MEQKVTEHHEQIVIPEPGIIRNSEGRIIATGWPDVPKGQWPFAYKELGKSVARQARKELDLRKHAPQNIFGAYKTREGLVFNLADKTLIVCLKSEVDSRMNRRKGEDVVRICDIGGGIGTLLTSGVAEYKSPYENKPRIGKYLNTTLTTLVIHDKDSLDEKRYAIDDIKPMAIELPPNDFYGRFDIIIAQNSVFFWSAHPELATLNLWKILRKGGVVLATIPCGYLPIPPQDPESTNIFPVEKYLAKSSLFNYEELLRHIDCTEIKLTKR